MVEQYFKRGLSQKVLEGYSSSTNPKPDKQKRATYKKGEMGKLLLMTPTLADVVLAYEHAWFRPGVPDKTAFNLFCTCSVMDSEDVSPQACPVCAEQMFCDFVSRRFRAYIAAIDMRLWNIDGKQWSHTPTLWALPKVQADLLADLVTDYTKGKEVVQGLMVEVRRSGDQAPGCGNHFQIKSYTKDVWGFLVRSPRTQMYQEKTWKRKNIKLSAEQAAREFFAVPEIEKMIAPTTQAKEYFLAYVRRAMGSPLQSQGSEQGSWGAPSSAPSSPQKPEFASSFSSFQEESGSEFPEGMAPKPAYEETMGGVPPAPTYEESWEGASPFEASVEEFGMVTEVPAGVSEVPKEAPPKEAASEVHKESVKETRKKPKEPKKKKFTDPAKIAEEIVQDMPKEKKEIKAEDFDGFAE